MSEERLKSYAVLLLRLALGTMFIAHSIIYMTMTLTLAGTVAFFASLGLRQLSLKRWVDCYSFWASKPAGWRLLSLPS
jgi:uncharacterized membrane protein YphA (DoxX/SURF4 family)